MAPFSANGSVIQGCFPHGLPRHLLVSAKVAQPVRDTGSALRLPDHLADFGRAGMGQKLPQSVQLKMETLFGTSFADVRVHVSNQPAKLGALALTHGPNIHFSFGQFNPDTRQGQQMLAHELAHVVQQRSGRARNPFGAGVAVLHDRALEADAERMAARAMLMPQTVQPKMPPAPAPPARAAVVQRTTITQAGYTTGDMFGIAATLIANPNMHIVIAKGPGPGRRFHDMTDKADMIAAFYRESGIHASRIHVLDVPNVRSAGPAMKNEAFRVEKNVLLNPKSNGKIKTEDIWPVGSGTTYIATNFSGGMRDVIRTAWGVNDRKDDEIAAWLRSLGIAASGRRVAIIWSRFSGKKGDIHLEHDTSHEGVNQIVALAAQHYDAILITGDSTVMPGRQSKYDLTVLAARRKGHRNVFNITGFWTSQSLLLRAWDGNTRTGQFRLYDYLNRKFDSARHLGFRSGNLEAMAMMGFTVRYMEEPDSEGSQRMEKWHDTGRGRTALGGMATGYERLRVEAPPTRSGKYLKDTMNWTIRKVHPVTGVVSYVEEERWGPRPIWAPGRQSSVVKPSDIRLYRAGFTESDLHSIGEYLQVPDQRMTMTRIDTPGVPASDLRVRMAQGLAMTILRLNLGFSTSDLDHHYRMIARKVHGDKTGQGDTKMQALNWARDIMRGDFSQVVSAGNYLALTW